MAFSRRSHGHYLHVHFLCPRARCAAGRWELLHRGTRLHEVSSSQLLRSCPALLAAGSSKHLQRLTHAPSWNQDTRLTSDEPGASNENGGARYFRSQISRGSSLHAPAYVRLKPIDPASTQNLGWTANNPGQVIGVRQDLGRRDSTPRLVAKHFSRCGVITCQAGDLVLQ